MQKIYSVCTLFFLFFFGSAKAATLIERDFFHSNNTIPDSYLKSNKPTIADYFLENSNSDPETD